MFGEHELKTQFIKIGDTKIHLLEASPGLVRYRREDLEKLIKIKDGEKLSVLPAPAIGYGVRLLMIKLREPLIIPPKDSLQGFVDAPVEVEVRVGGTSIDRFQVSREKYALYGTIEAGAIARYHVGSLEVNEPSMMGVIKMVISNPSSEWKTLEKLVMPIWNTTMYYSPERAYYPLIIVTLKNHVPEVNNTGRAPREGLVSVGPGDALPNFLMRW
ncbi:DUF432 domain-containing protein [Thermococcus sp. Bubb.Bath]|uniref:DUF432 domain-containing protein n=1 Tax=Thermococcus sp. Bubb.Bath TaxID=1638242 RepID=UPI00143AA45A|nr:DUF432 domain-containing protein [Thermococcus sp. Bubb.Bath]NJF24124.1 DUF432 domain-containing protein [Thermococcus sp. Bubb.Bath]